MAAPGFGAQVPRGQAGVVLSVTYPDGRPPRRIGLAAPPIVANPIFRPFRHLWYRLVEAPAFERNVAAHNAEVAAMTPQEA
jgi:hypothetical protein